MSTFTIKPITKTETLTQTAPIPTAEEAEYVLLQAVKKYKELQAQIAFLQAELKSPRAVIESAVSATKEGKIITPQFKASLSPVETERFDKKAAIGALGREVLEPFLSTSVSLRLLVS